MEQDTLYELKYPIGTFTAPEHITIQHIKDWILSVEMFPSHLNALVEGIAEKSLDTPYRPGGWTVRQVVHHLPDSHLNSYIRFKWALTEPGPLIKAYFEARWADLPDYQAPIDASLELLAAVHKKWVRLLRSMTETQWKRYFIHPETNENVSLQHAVGTYAWHGHHHYAHIARVLNKPLIP